MKASSLVLNHLGVAFLGGILALIARPQLPDESKLQDISKVNAPPYSRQAAATRSTREKNRSSPETPEDFERVWKALPERGLSKQERITVQRRLFYEWAKVDLEGALTAAITEASFIKYKRLYPNYDPFFNGPFANTFDEAFQRDPETSWNLIQSEGISSGGFCLPLAWSRAVASSHTGILLEKLPELNGNQQAEAVQLVTNNKANLMDRKDDAANILRSLPASSVDLENLLSFLEKRSPEEIGSELSQVEDLSQRDGRLLIAELVGTNDIYRSSAKRTQAIQSLKQFKNQIPAEVFGEVVYQTMVGPRPNYFFVNKSTARSTIELIDLMVENESWTQLAREQTARRLDSHTNALPSEELATWAVNLPEREELAELFDRGVDNYISENIDLAWDWIQSFPDGKWRDRALAEYSQQTLKVNNDYEDSLRAIEAIADPKLRESTRAELSRLVQD